MQLLFATGAALTLMIVANSAGAGDSAAATPHTEGPAATADAKEAQPDFRWERQRRYHPRQGWRTTWRRVEITPEPRAEVEQPAVSYRWERQHRYHPRHGSRIRWVRVRAQD